MVVNGSESSGRGQDPSMLLSSAQLDEFKAEGAVPIRGLVPTNVLEGWRAQVRAACTGGVDLEDPSTWRPGRYGPEGGWPDFTPNLYELQSLQSIAEQIGGGAFAVSSPAGLPPEPTQVPMTRIILPDAPGTEWAPPLTSGHLDGYAAGWGGGFMAIIAILLWDLSSPRGGGMAYWPRSHLANHRHFLKHPEQFDGSYMFTEPVKSGGHEALLKGDPSVGEMAFMTGRAGDAMLLHGLTTHVGSANQAGSQQPRVTQFARYTHRKMREQAPMVMFPDKDGKPWSPPKEAGSPAEAQEHATATGFLPLDHPGRKLERYEVPENLWKYWGPALNS